MSFLTRTKTIFALARPHWLGWLGALSRALLAAEPSPEDAAEREASVFQPRDLRS